MTPPTEHPTPAQWAMIVAVRDIVERLDARPVPPQGIVGSRKGRHGVTNIVELEGR